MLICIFSKYCIVLIVRSSNNIRISVSVPSCHNLCQLGSTFWVTAFKFTNHREMNWRVFVILNIGVSFGVTDLIFIIHDIISGVFIWRLFLCETFLLSFSFNMTSLLNKSSISQFSIYTLEHSRVTVLLLVDLVTKFDKILVIFVHSICITTIWTFLFCLGNILSIFFMIFFLFFIMFLILIFILRIFRHLCKKFRQIKLSFWQFIN